MQDSWGSAYDGGPTQPGSGAGGVFRFADLDAALDNAPKAAPQLSAAATHRLASGVARAQDSQQGAPNCSSCAAEAGPELPAFYLHAAGEPARAADPGLEPAQAAHVAELLRLYAEQEGQVAGPCTAPPSSSPCHRQLCRTWRSALRSLQCKGPCLATSARRDPAATSKPFR